MGPHYVQSYIIDAEVGLSLGGGIPPHQFLGESRRILSTHPTRHKRGVCLDEGRVKVIEASLGWQTLFKPRPFKSTSAGTHRRVLKRSTTLLVVHQKFFQTHAFDSFQTVKVHVYVLRENIVPDWSGK